MVHAYAERALPVYGSGDVCWEGEAPDEGCIQGVEKKASSGEQHILPVALGIAQTFNMDVDVLYSLSGGEIRFIFKRLTDIVYEVTKNLPSTERIATELATKILRELAERRLEALPLTAGDRNILHKMTESPFRIRDYAKFKLKSQQVLSKRVRRLLKMELLQSERISAKNVVYRTVPDVNIAYSQF